MTKQQPRQQGCTQSLDSTHTRERTELRTYSNDIRLNADRFIRYIYTFQNRNKEWCGLIQDHVLDISWLHAFNIYWYLLYQFGIYVANCDWEL